MVYLNTLLLLHSALMPSVVKMPLNGWLEAVHLIVMEITLLIMELCFLNFSGNPAINYQLLPASGEFCHLLIFANSLDPDHADRTLGLIWIQNVRHSDSVLEIFRKG